LTWSSFVVQTPRTFKIALVLLSVLHKRPKRVFENSCGWRDLRRTTSWGQSVSPV